MLTINIDLVYIITVLFSFTLNLTFPYRSITTRYRQNSRYNRILKVVQFYLLLSNSQNSFNQSELRDIKYQSYDTPFSDNHILTIFSNENVEIYLNEQNLWWPRTKNKYVEYNYFLNIDSNWKSTN